MGKTALKVSEFHSVTGNIQYGIYRPEGDAPDKGFPLIVYLHGAGERGEPFEKVYRHSLPRYIQAGESFPAVILVPQCPGRVVWNNIVFGLKELIDSVIREYRIDPRRVSITGQSMGGFGTWEMGLTYSNFFSCMAPVCGGGMAWRCCNLINTPVWAFHGDADEVVPLSASLEMVDAVNRAGGEARLTILHGVGHDGWDFIFHETDLVHWLIGHCREDFSENREAFDEW